MRQPSGFINPDFLNYVCKLNKAIHDLRQALSAWFSKLNNQLLSLGFRESKFERSLFIFRNFAPILFVLVYVDDILVTRSNSQIIFEFISALSICFPVKDLWSLHHVLGIEVNRTK